MVCRDIWLMDVIYLPRYPPVDTAGYNISDIAPPTDLTALLNPTPPDFPATVGYYCEPTGPVAGIVQQLSG